MLRFLEINIIFKIYPMDSKGQDGEALKTFPREFGIPDHLIFDGFQEQCGKETESMKQIGRMITLITETSITIDILCGRHYT